MSEHTRRPQSYVLVNGCHNCKNCLVLAEIDCETVFYCTYNAPNRPLCSNFSAKVMTSIQWLKEAGREDESKDIALWGNDYLEYKRAVTKPLYDAWEEWAHGRQVKPWGKCNNWEPRDV